MGQLERVVEEKKDQKRKQSSAARVKSSQTYLSFNPNKDEKAAIAEMAMDYFEIMDYMSTYLQDGYRLNWKFIEAQECYVWTLSESKSDWQTNRALTCWHVDYEKALKMLYYCLHNRFEGWPDNMRSGVITDLEW